MEIKQKKGYDGYQPYSYLERGVDYPAIEWSQWDWAGRHIIELNEEQEAMYEEIIAKYPYISVHRASGLHSGGHEPGKLLCFHAAGTDWCGYEALSYSNLDCIFDNMMDGTNIISSPGGWKWIDIIHDLGMRLCDLAHQDFLIQCKTVDDILPPKRGKDGLGALH